MTKQFRELVSFGEAFSEWEKVLRECGFFEGSGSETVDLFESSGRVLGKDVEAKVGVPYFDRSTMDGYAVTAEDTFGAGEQDPVVLKLTGSIEPGEMPEIFVEKGCAVEISTGAALPDGTDAVVKVEEVDRVDEDLYVRKAVSPGDNVMEKGYDISKGEKVLSKGVRIGFRETGLLASVGLRRVEVRNKPRIGFFSTGNELVEPGNELSRGQIFDVNSFVLNYCLEESGCDPFFKGIAKDNKEALTKVVKGLVNGENDFDLVIASGSTSAGAKDLLYQVIEEEGELVLHGLRLKPGKPILIGKIEGVPFIGLPGNPASSFVGFRKIVEPFLRKVNGLPSRRSRKAVLSKDVKSSSGRREIKFVSVTERSGKILVEPIEKISGSVTLLQDADGFLEVPENVYRIDEGEEVDLFLLNFPETS